jgi:hypothetical protein
MISFVTMSFFIDKYKHLLMTALIMLLMVPCVVKKGMKSRLHLETRAHVTYASCNTNLDHTYSHSIIDNSHVQQSNADFPLFAVVSIHNFNLNSITVKAQTTSVYVSSVPIYILNEQYRI